MSATTEIVEIPTFQTAEQLMDFLLSEFMFMAAMGGMIILTNDDLHILADILQKFTSSSARTKNQTETDNHEKGNR